MKSKGTKLLLVLAIFISLGLFLYGCGASSGSSPSTSTENEETTSVDESNTNSYPNRDFYFATSIAGFLSNTDYGRAVSLIQEAGSDNVRFMSRWGGLHWELIEPEKGNFDWSSADEYYSEAAKTGMSVLANIYPDMPDWDVAPSESAMGYPNDMDEYVNFVKKAAERYDGDGVDDAPNSPKVDAWILGVEMERGDEWWTGTPQQYADLFVKTYYAIKEANPNAVVMTYGCNIILTEEQGQLEIFTKPFLEELRNLTKDKSDFSFVYAIHYYPSTSNYQEEYKHAISKAREMLDSVGFSDIPIVVTDVGIFVRKDDPLRERKAATDVIKVYTTAMAMGVKQVVWAQLSDGDHGDTLEAGLISSDEEGNIYKNLAFYTYKLMVDKLGKTTCKAQVISESDGVYVYRFEGQEGNFWVIWNENAEEEKVVLSDISSEQVLVTQAVPNADSGKELNDADYPTFFNTEVKQVENGEVTLDVGKEPIFVEEKQS